MEENNHVTDARNGIQHWNFVAVLENGFKLRLPRQSNRPAWQCYPNWMLEERLVKIVHIHCCILSLEVEFAGSLPKRSSRLPAGNNHKESVRCRIQTYGIVGNLSGKKRRKVNTMSVYLTDWKHLFLTAKLKANSSKTSRLPNHNLKPQGVTTAKWKLSTSTFWWYCLSVFFLYFFDIYLERETWQWKVFKKILYAKRLHLKPAEYTATSGNPLVFPITKRNWSIWVKTDLRGISTKN